MTPTPEALEAAREIIDRYSATHGLPLHLGEHVVRLIENDIATALTDFAARAVEGEREACAALADNHYSEEHDRLRLGVTENTDITTGKMGMAFDLARLIRARGSEKT